MFGGIHAHAPEVCLIPLCSFGLRGEEVPHLGGDLAFPWAHSEQDSLVFGLLLTHLGALVGMPLGGASTIQYIQY